MTHEWMCNTGAIVALSQHISGWDWVRLTSTCKILRMYSSWNSELVLRISGSCQNLPDGLTCVEVVYYGPVINVVNLPDTLVSLSIAFDSPVVSSACEWVLPKKLRSLTIGGRFNQMVFGIGSPDVYWHLPNKLEELVISTNEWNQPVFDPISGKGWVLPETLRLLDIAGGFNHPVFNTVTHTGWELPDKLVNLYLSGTFDQNVFDNVTGEGWRLPETLETLWIGPHFNRPVFNGEEGWILPRPLRELHIGKAFRQVVAKDGQSWELPDSLLELTIGISWEPGRKPYKGIKFWNLPQSLLSARLGRKFGVLNERHQPGNFIGNSNGYN